MIHITFKDYKHEVIVLNALVGELRKENKELKTEADINRARLGDAKSLHEVDSNQIRDLKQMVNDMRSRNEELYEQLEKDRSDNCELQNLYAEKCKELNEVKNYADKITQTSANLEEKLAAYNRDGYVTLQKSFYEQIKADAERFREERDKHNANRRKRRAAKKVAQGKPE